MNSGNSGTGRPGRRLNANRPQNANSSGNNLRRGARELTAGGFVPYHQRQLAEGLRFLSGLARLRQPAPPPINPPPPRRRRPLPAGSESGTIFSRTLSGTRNISNNLLGGIRDIRLRLRRLRLRRARILARRDRYRQRLRRAVARDRRRVLIDNLVAIQEDIERTNELIENLTEQRDHFLNVWEAAGHRVRH